jgi:hypothetical protein
MKNSLLLATALSLATAASAQMPDYSICPDWTGTDLNGTSYNLYDILDSGYTVIVDVSAAWCGPCWNYHNGHALETFYAAHGPDGDNKARVFFIEGEGTNTLAQLQGVNASNTYAGASQGNWITGTPYPIIDDASIANLLQIGYFPTVYRICPNRMIFEVGAVSASALWTSCQQCGKYMADSPTDAAVLPNTADQVVCIGNPANLNVRVQNTGTTPLTNVTIEAKRGNTVLGTFDWTGDLGTYEVETVTVANFTPTLATNTITYTILTTDDEPANNTATGGVSADNTVMPSVEVEFVLKTDQYPNETQWRLFDEAGNVVKQDPPGNYAANTEYTENWTLDDNTCYRFVIADGAGDGICCSYGNGYFRLRAHGQNVITGGSFTNVKSEPFLTSILASVGENTLETGLAVFPNPTEGRVNVNLNLPAATKANITVTNILGAVVYQGTHAFAAGTQTATLDLSDLAQGTYTLNILADGMTATRKVTIAH